MGGISQASNSYKFKKLDSVMRMDMIVSFGFVGGRQRKGVVARGRRLKKNLFWLFYTELFCAYLAERGEHVPEVVVFDEPIPVLVDHVESLLELLDLVLVEHGEDIGSSALSPLLRLGPGRLPARHLAVAAGLLAGKRQKRGGPPRTRNIFATN